MKCRPMKKVLLVPVVAIILGSCLWGSEKKWNIDHLSLSFYCGQKQPVAQVMVTEMRCRPNWYLRLNWFKNAKPTHVACGPVRYTDANYRLSIVANARSELLADTSPPTVPISGRSHAVDSDPVRPCTFCSDRWKLLSWSWYWHLWSQSSRISPEYY